MERMNKGWRTGLLGVVLGAAVLEAQPPSNAVAQLRVRVTDETGLPVARARVAVSTFNTWVPGRAGVGRDENATVVGVTDTNGMTVLSLKSETGRLGCMVLPVAGYHWHLGTDYAFTNAAAGRWEPWSPLLPVTLKRIDTGLVPEPPAGVPASGGKPVTPKDPGIALPALFPEEAR